MIGRRDLGKLAAAGACLLWARRGHALGRTLLAGKFQFSLPISLRSMDPHDIGDPVAALFGAGVFDSLLLHDKRGFTPALAESLPERQGTAVAVKLRAGLRTASGKGIDARDVVASLKRARARGAAAILDAIGPASVSLKDPHTILFTKGSPATAIVALASPLCAIVPRDFDPKKPDGTGAFGATLTSGQLTLFRNVNAAMGPSFLEQIVVREAADLRDSLRDFEVGREDIGWLGTGLFQGRPDAERFDLGSVATFVLVASSGAGALAKPGALQALVDSVPRAAMGHLGLGALPAGSSSATYDGPPIDLWVEGSVHMVEIAEAIAGVLSGPDHEITVRRGTRDEIAARQKRGDAMLSLHVARPLGTATASPAASLQMLEDPTRTSVAAKSAAPREAARAMRVAVVGELRVAGGKSGDFVFVPHVKGGWDLAASSVKKKPRP